MIIARTATAAAVLLALAVAACGDDAGEDAAASTTTTATPGSTPAPAELPQDACALVADAAAATGLELADPLPGGDEVRRVCTWSAAEPGHVGVTVGIQGGSRFDDKAETSAAALGDGVEVDGVGDRALFFFADDDIPEGVGGVLVELGDLTVDVTLQGVDEATMRSAATAIAAAAVAQLG